MSNVPSRFLDISHKLPMSCHRQRIFEPRAISSEKVARMGLLE
jgi:hypothetical protein